MKQYYVNRTVLSIIVCMAVQLFVLGSSNLEANTSACKTNCYTSRNLYLPRAFSSYSMHEILHNGFLVGLNHTKEDHHAYTAFTFEYMQNFGSKSCCRSNLGALPFWSGTNSMTIGNNKGKADVDAYQFGLGDVEVDATGIAGAVHLCPKVQHIGGDLMFYYTHLNNKPSMYFKVHAPLGAMIIDPRLSESPAAVPNDALGFKQTTLTGTDIDFQFFNYPSPDRGYQSIVHAWIGGNGSCNSLDGSSSRPIRLEYGRFADAKRTTIRISDISATLGYNFLVREEGYVGAGLKFTCPTGNDPQADFALEPIFGRGGAWGFGGEVTGYYEIWHDSKNSSKYLDVRLQGEVLHLMPGKKANWRSFDLKQNGLGSKYLLVQHYLATYLKDTAAPFAASQVVGPRTLTQAINITTLPVISRIAVEGSVALMTNYHSNDWSVGLGAEFWGRSQEKLSIDTYSATVLRLPNLNHYAVLGRQLSAYTINGQPNNVNTYYCEPLARINESQDPVRLTGTPPTVTNVGVVLPKGIADARKSENRIPAEFSDALDICGAQAPAVVTGKLFAQLEHTWNDHCYAPSIGIVSGVEFASNNSIPWLWSAGVQGRLSF